MFEPLKFDCILCFSCDRQLMVWDSRQMKTPIADTNVGGMIQRLKWEPLQGNYILTADWKDGFHITDTSCVKSVYNISPRNETPYPLTIIVLQFEILYSFVCVGVLWPSQPIGIMSSAVSLPNHTFTGHA